ncbi:MAG: hypothetical protein RDV41_12840 [Planctomycetota bacterium]|nr:hypothetical protein [Planctomycetota bacterium]
MKRIKLAPSTSPSVGMSFDGPALCCGCLAENPETCVTLGQSALLTHHDTETDHSASLTMPVCTRCLSLFTDRDWRYGVKVGA